MFGGKGKEVKGKKNSLQQSWQTGAVKGEGLSTNTQRRRRGERSSLSKGNLQVSQKMGASKGGVNSGKRKKEDGAPKVGELAG